MILKKTGSVKSANYSAEVITNKKRRWVDCDQCKSAFHVKCIPKSHLNLYGLDDDEDEEDEFAFICHFCVDEKSDDNLADCLTSSESENELS